MPSKKVKSKAGTKNGKSPSKAAEDPTTMARLLGSMTIRLPSKGTNPQNTDGGNAQHKRIQTAQHRLGNNSRTFIEGMVNKTAMDNSDFAQTGHSNLEGSGHPSKVQSAGHTMENEGTEVPRASQGSRQASRTTNRQNSSGRSTIFETEEDEKMASRQTRISTMAPSERKSQENWAQSMLKRTGCCPEKYAWTRTRDDKGYQCEGLHHLITDNFISKGHGGVWLLPHPRDTTIRWGPYYPHSKYKGTFLWGGEGIRNPRHPAFIDEFGSCLFEELLGRTQPMARKKSSGLYGSQNSGSRGTGSRMTS